MAALTCRDEVVYVKPEIGPGADCDLMMNFSRNHALAAETELAEGRDREFVLSQLSPMVVVAPLYCVSTCAISQACVLAALTAILSEVRTRLRAAGLGWDGSHCTPSLSPYADRSAKISIGGNFRRVRFALAWRTEPYFIYTLSEADCTRSGEQIRAG